MKKFLFDMWYGAFAEYYAAHSKCERRKMLTINDVKEHCRDVERGIEKAGADGVDLCEFFEDIQMI